MADTKGTIVVIGSGAAGSAASRLLADAGWHVTLVERDRVGGTCLWRGCMPKKALFHAAATRRLLLKADEFGMTPHDGSFDWPAILGWKWHAQETYAGDQEASFADRGVELIKGDASFVAADAIEVGDRRIEFDQAIIATGSKPVRPPIEGADLADTSEEALRFPDVPRSLAIVGGGFVAFEFAGIFASLGTKITIVTHGPRPLEMVDEDVASIAVRHLERLDSEFFNECTVDAISKGLDGLLVQFTDSTGIEHGIDVERVLLATGRRPALDGLGLDVAGVELDEHGRIVHDQFMRTTNPAVWVAGDAAGGMMQTPLASYEGRTIGHSIDSGEPIAPDCSAVPTTVFTVPPLAHVGASEADLKKRNVPYRVSVQTLEYLGAAVIDDEREGMVKYLFAEETGRLLGAYVAAPTAHDLIYAAAVAVRKGATDAELQEILGVHPAYSEALNWAAF